MLQRKAKYKPTQTTDNIGMSTVMFLDRCTDALRRSGKEDAAFYYGQLVDHIRKGGRMNESEDVYQVLGL